MKACNHLVQTLAHTSNHVSANTNACCSFSSQSVWGVVRCVSHSLSLSLTSNVDEFSFLYHLCFSSFSSPWFSLSLPHPLSLCLSVFTKGRGLTFTSTRVLVRAHVDRPGLPPTDTVDHTLCVIRALVPTLAFAPPHVCHRQRDWAHAAGHRHFWRGLHI